MDARIGASGLAGAGLAPQARASLVLRAVGLTKRYGRVVALDGLDLEVGAGEVHAFLGPNGSGKTTAIRVLLGLLKADAGEVTLLGGDPWRDAVELHRRVAYVPGDVTLWPGLTGGEIIDLLGRMRGGLDVKRRKALTERFDLDISKKARAYSRGNRQKVALIAALASGAEMLLLDEPTAGLDPVMEAIFRECVSEERHDGRTILLSSHILAEAEALADWVTIIRDGRTVETGVLAEMRHLARISVEAELAAPVAFGEVAGVHELVAGYVFAFAACGSAAKGAGTILGASAVLRRYLLRVGYQATVVHAYLSALMLLAGLAPAVYATSAVLGLRAEETGNLAEPVLATAAGRIRWGLSHISVAVAGACLLLAVAGLSAGLGYGIVTGSVSAQVPQLLGTALARLPAVLVLAAVGSCCPGCCPGSPPHWRGAWWRWQGLSRCSARRCSGRAG
jgi:ABC-2 type transport system ATP-binding protein